MIPMRSNGSYLLEAQTNICIHAKINTYIYTKYDIGWVELCYNDTEAHWYFWFEWNLLILLSFFLNQKLLHCSLVTKVPGVNQKVKFKKLVSYEKDI